MGNAADKEYAEATFTPVAIHEGDLNCIDPSCVLKEPIKLKQSGSKWVKEDGTEVVQFESHGFFAKGKSIFVYGQEVGTVAAVTGFTHDTVCGWSSVKNITSSYCMASYQSISATKLRI